MQRGHDRGRDDRHNWLLPSEHNHHCFETRLARKPRFFAPLSAMSLPRNRYRLRKIALTFRSFFCRFFGAAQKQDLQTYDRPMKLNLK